MSVSQLRAWHVTAIEIALDLEALRFLDPSYLPLSGKAEPRICLVAAFASTAQLKRIIAAVERAVPARPPSGLRVAPSFTRWAADAVPTSISIQPMPALLRLQAKLVRAIEPGLLHDGPLLAFGEARNVGEAAARYINNFIPGKALPTFEPANAKGTFEPTDLRAVGVTVYRLGDRGAPESILAHWAYPHDWRRSLPLESGP